LATWADVQTYIRRNYTSRELDDGTMVITFTFDDGRSHNCFVQTNTDEGKWVIFQGFVADWSPENAVRAIEKNKNFFGVSRFIDWVVLTHAQLTETAVPDEIDRALLGIAMAADDLEAEVTGQDNF
jgi:hypothetical protein